MAAKTALVMRPTGVQGRGAAKHLIRKGWRVHALVTNASSDRAVGLESLGHNVTLFQGTWKDAASIEAAVKGCQALLLVQLPSFSDDSEVQEARVVLNIAKAAGVQHVVFPTTLPLNNPNIWEQEKDSPVAPAVLNKGDVEKIVRASGLTWTLLRPGYFLTNLLPPVVYWMYPEFKDRKFVNSYGPDCVLTLVDPDDIGAFVVAAFEDPKKFGGQTISVVGENVRVDKILVELERVSGQTIKAVYRTPEETEKARSSPFVAGQITSIGLAKWVDLEGVKSWGVPLTTFAQFLEKHKDEFAM
ncbi:NAD(P)-binding protein [Cucurbitaria berberidis CBS 394.84]|uniref:NAD(P)-binding protein n=1 Tax=Cucurbitaria berberidis CBS 394.84 TaxID=1168544 RepID=A0A9P4GBF0_9PLEO|nr:NAD(P)-binding protein [Cucurbitaria berberidis CBS 394.84]KAF1842155.1 NAD(P)-binding protein [Cucurbitaria berberidis CBS 394.84]